MTLRWPSKDAARLVEAAMPNGLRAVAIGRPGTATVATKLLMKAGSRHDGDRHGIGHSEARPVPRS